MRHFRLTLGMFMSVMIYGFRDIQEADFAACSHFPESQKWLLPIVSYSLISYATKQKGRKPIRRASAAFN